jgi:small subunit ribosomal protein S19e
MSDNELPTVNNIYHVKPSDIIARLAEKLKSSYTEINPPKEIRFWKTSCSKEFPPEDPEGFWYVRSASLLRKLAMHKIVGVGKLRKMYSRSKKKGVRPSQSQKASGGIIRRCLQQLERAGLVETVEHEGRKLTAEKQSFIDKTAHEIIRESDVF